MFKMYKIHVNKSICKYLCPHEGLSLGTLHVETHSGAVAAVRGVNVRPIAIAPRKTPYGTK
jgi:hypothetical protein